MTCDACRQPATELTYAGEQHLCHACYESAIAANRSRGDIPACAECGGRLAVRDEEPERMNGMFFLDCVACDRTYAAFTGQPIRPWHDHQPRCPCGHYARYHGRPVAFGRRDPDEVWLYRCRGCGRRIEVRTDRPRLDIHVSEQNLRPPRVRVTKEPS